MSLKTSLSIAAGAACVGFIGYCFYFDHKRRSDPNFKQKLRQRRKLAKQNAKGSNQTQFPDMRDPEAIQRFFLQEVQVGEELLGTGDVETGVEHLANAVAVCGQPQQLLNVLQQTLPSAVFQLLLLRLPQVTQRFARHAASSVPGPQVAMMGAHGADQQMGQGESTTAKLVEDDPE